jgi:hypothetical protein
MAITGSTVSMYQGNRKILRCTIADPDGLLISLAGKRITFALARFDQNGNPLKTNPLIDLNNDDDPAQVTVVDEDELIVDITLLDADTRLLTPTDYYFEIEVVDEDGNSGVVSTGTVTINTNLPNG